jgi:hypothetical protein
MRARFRSPHRAGPGRAVAVAEAEAEARRGVACRVVSCRDETRRDETRCDLPVTVTVTVMRMHTVTGNCRLMGIMVVSCVHVHSPLLSSAPI